MPSMPPPPMLCSYSTLILAQLPKAIWPLYGEGHSGDKETYFIQSCLEFFQAVLILIQNLCMHDKAYNVWHGISYHSVCISRAIVYADHSFSIEPPFAVCHCPLQCRLLFLELFQSSLQLKLHYRIVD